MTSRIPTNTCAIFPIDQCPKMGRGCSFDHTLKTYEFGQRCPNSDCSFRHPPDCFNFQQGICGYHSSYPSCSFFHPKARKTTPEEHEIIKELKHETYVTKKKIDKFEKLVDTLRTEILTMKKIKDEIKEELTGKIKNDITEHFNFL